MAEVLVNEYAPDVVPHPGETLQEVLAERELTQAELARRTNRPTKTINEIIRGKAAITADTALQLELALGIPASFWTNYQALHDACLARLHDDERLEGYTQWLTRWPLREMVAREWVKEVDRTSDQVREVLRFFGVATPEACELLHTYHGVLYRKQTTSVDERGNYAVLAWLRRGEMQAEKIECRPFTGSVRDVLPRLRALTCKPPEDFQDEVVALCAEHGVAVVFVPELTGTRLCGAARWIGVEKALIQLSLRYKTSDNLWFSFFHEMAHVLKHGKKSVFVDIENGGADDLEKEADRFAAETLIPTRDYQGFLRRRDFRLAAIQAFAGSIGIAAGIVVGRLQREGHIKYGVGEHLKQRLQFDGDRICLAPGQRQ